MPSKIARIVSAFLFLLSLGLVNLSQVVIYAASDKCVWTGATSADWATGSNWEDCDNGGVPENGDTLYFPENSQNKVMNNNISGLEILSLEIYGDEYNFNGNEVTLTGQNPIISTQNTIINFNLVIDPTSGNANILTQEDTYLNIGGDVNLSLGPLQKLIIGDVNNQGNVDFKGDISGNAGNQFYVAYGVLYLAGENSFVVDQVGSILDASILCMSTTCFGNSNNEILIEDYSVINFMVSGTYSNNITTGITSAKNPLIYAHDNLSLTGDLIVNDRLMVNQLKAGKNLQFTGNGTLNGAINVFGDNTSSNIKFNGPISGDGGFVVYSGNAWLSGAHTFKGDVTVKEGAVVMADKINSLGSNDGKTIIEKGASLHLDTQSDTTIAEPLQIAGEGTSPVQYRAAIYSTGDNTTLTGDITLTDDTTIYNGGILSSLTIEGVISGDHSISYISDAGASAEIRIGSEGAAANTYTGTTYILDGPVYFKKTLAIPGDIVINPEDYLPYASTVYMYAPNAIADDAIVTFNDESDTFLVGNTGSPEVIGGLVGDKGIISLQYDNTELVIDQDYDSTFGGDFYANGSSATFTKRGSGNLTLTGGMEFENDDDMNFKVEEGTLTVNGNLKTLNGGSNTKVQGTGTLKGNGTLGNLDASSGKVAPGNSPGKLNVSSLTLGSSSTFEVEIEGNQAGVSYDQVVSTGVVDLGNAELSVLPSYTPKVNETFTIITGSEINGTFNGLDDGSVINIDGLTFRINYLEGSVILTFINGTLLTKTGQNTAYIIGLGILLLITTAIVAKRSLESRVI